MDSSILSDVKKALNIGPDDDSFDLDIVMHINSAFTILDDLGVSTPTGQYAIDDATAKWSDLGFPDIRALRSYIVAQVRIWFDPPSNSFVQTALEKQLSELQWRIERRANV